MLPPYECIKKEAETLGLHSVGVLNLEPGFQLEGEGLQRWLSRGFHGEMHWMAGNLEKRLSPGSLMPGTQSVILAGMNYYPGETAPLRNAKARIARYAQGDDYHEVLKNRLKMLLSRLRSFYPALQGRALVDSAPVLEKALAVSAGLGWQGKNSLLITPTQGSWVFLGELLLSLPVPDPPLPQPVPNRCGSCRRCIEACPTQAIVEPSVVDATRCISYWTIEYKGEEIPHPIRKHLDGWLFGCDICQEVCPWNRKLQQETSEPAFMPRPWNHYPRLSEIETISEAQFRVRYRKSPIKRAKICGLKRNAQALSHGDKKTDPILK